MVSRKNGQVRRAWQKTNDTKRQETEKVTGGSAAIWKDEWRKVLRLSHPGRFDPNFTQAAIFCAGSVAGEGGFAEGEERRGRWNFVCIRTPGRRLRYARRKAASPEGVSALARRYGLGRCTVRKWKHREDTMDRSHTAHHLQTTMNSAQEAIAVYLRRHGVGNLRDLAPEGGESAGLSPHGCKVSAQMKDETKRRDLFVAIDRATRWVYSQGQGGQDRSERPDFPAKPRPRLSDSHPEAPDGQREVIHRPALLSRQTGQRPARIRPTVRRAGHRNIA
jgi:hypothetical protein